MGNPGETQMQSRTGVLSTLLILLVPLHALQIKRLISADCRGRTHRSNQYHRTLVFDGKV